MTSARPDIRLTGRSRRFSMASPGNVPAGHPPVLVWDPVHRRQVCRLHLRVRYAETDRMGIAYNAHYLAWFEVGRTELMRCSGMSYLSVEERGLNLPLIEAALRLRAPIRYDDMIEIEARVERIRSRAIIFGYAIRRGDEAMAEGTTTHACVDARRNEAVTLPAWLREHLARLGGTRS